MDESGNDLDFYTYLTLFSADHSSNEQEGGPLASLNGKLLVSPKSMMNGGFSFVADPKPEVYKFTKSESNSHRQEEEEDYSPP